MDDELTTAEVLKDGLQDVVESGATAAGRVASIITAAIGDVAHALGEFGTDVFQIRDGMWRALNNRGGD